MIFFFSEGHGNNQREIEINLRLVKGLAAVKQVSKSTRRVSRCLSHGVARILFPMFPTVLLAYVSPSQACFFEFKLSTLLGHLCEVNPPPESILMGASSDVAASISACSSPPECHRHRYPPKAILLSQGTRSGNLVYASEVSLRECMGLRYLRI